MMLAALSISDYIALGTFGLMIAGKLLTDIAAYLNQRHQTSLSNITGMAGREAASIARVISTLSPANVVDPKQLEVNLVNASTDHVLREMSSSAGVVGADEARVKRILQQEVDKLLLVAPMPPLASTVPAPAPVVVGKPS